MTLERKNHNKGTAEQAYCTLRVRFVLCVVVPEVALTTIVYVPAGVPVWLAGLFEPPHATIMASAIPVESSVRLAPVLGLRLPNATKANGTSVTTRNTPNRDCRMPPPIAASALLRAAVDTLTVKGSAEFPLTLIELGLAVHDALAGMPEHAIVRVPLKLPIGVRARL
jgi:hypothetical protein